MMQRRLPQWFRQKLPEAHAMQSMTGLLAAKDLHTVCESALCPNRGLCFARQTATFMILGDVCTRRCTFCAVTKGTPQPIDEDEPVRVVEAAQTLGLHYVVVTSVTRDDLPDGGASQFSHTIELLHKNGIAVEVLIPDFCGSMAALEKVVEARPEVINHNVETVPRLYSTVRPGADYHRSLALIAAVALLDPGIVTKSGLMLGLGEKQEEVVDVMADLLEHGCDLLTIGQYLQPSPNHHPVVDFIMPEHFAEYASVALAMGFKGAPSAPFVRSSFRASELYERAQHASPLPPPPTPSPLNDGGREGEEHVASLQRPRVGLFLLASGPHVYPGQE